MNYFESQENTLYIGGENHSPITGEFYTAVDIFSDLHNKQVFIMLILSIFSVWLHKAIAVMMVPFEIPIKVHISSLYIKMLIIDRNWYEK
ncbi:MAG: hypothetical protein SCH70_11620 [Candidatus Methanoperedens sp.]|nr:hypothetical protein [Candidatus Methanoperedens sp.]